MRLLAELEPGGYRGRVIVATKSGSVVIATPCGGIAGTREALQVAGGSAVGEGAEVFLWVARGAILRAGEGVGWGWVVTLRVLPL